MKKTKKYKNSGQKRQDPMKSNKFFRFTGHIEKSKISTEMGTVPTSNKERLGIVKMKQGLQKDSENLVFIHATVLIKVF